MLLAIVQDAEKEIQFIYNLYLKYVNQYNIPGNWPAADTFHKGLLSVISSRELLTTEQQKFLTFLLNNRDVLSSLRSGINANTLAIPDRPGIQIKLFDKLKENGSEVKILLEEMTEDNYDVKVVDTNQVVTPDVDVKIVDVETLSKTAPPSIDVNILPVNKTKPNKIIHVTNYIPTENIKSLSLKNRVNMSIKSIDSVRLTNVYRLGCCFEVVKASPPGWVIKKLERSAKTTGISTRHLAYLHDLLQSAADMCDQDDIILYSNMDCCVTPQIYQDIMSNQAPVMMFHRRDTKSTRSLYKLFTRPYTLKKTGVDAVAMTKSIYVQFYKHMLPDMVIGEPHWDTVFNNLTIENKIEHSRNTTALYHIEHEMTWHIHKLSAAGKYNKQLMHNCIEYGLIQDGTIELQSDTLNLIIDSQDSKIIQIYDLCEKLQGQETCIVQLSPETVTSCKYRDIRYVNKTVITLNDKQLHVDQTNALINLYTLTNQNYKRINFYIFKQNKKTLEPDHVIDYNTFEPYDIYENINNPLYIHLNDHGLLESC